jgi:catechol 2,3-dioxygenase-like lactoylglutathione lyase family enzyme
MKVICFLWWEGGSCRIGSILQPEIYPPAKELGQELPRCGFYIRPEDIPMHLRRLDRYKIPHTDPVKTTAEGDEGTAIYFADPDGNQYEFWAPVQMPQGAMEIATDERVGRISHAVYGCRDLAKTAAFFEKYCGVQAEQNSNTAEGTLVLRLRAGARLIYKLVDKVDERVAGHGPWWDMHTALTVREEEFFPNYRCMWDGLPEEETDKANANLSIEQQEALPARTGLHRSPVGLKERDL